MGQGTSHQAICTCDGIVKPFNYRAAATKLIVVNVYGKLLFYLKNKQVKTW